MLLTLLRVRGWRALLTGLLCLALACPAAPALAQALPTLGEDGALGAGAERRLGDRIMRAIYRDSDYLEDPVLQDYLLSLWQPLVAAARQRGEINAETDEHFAWQSFLIKDRSINAFALPGGYMGVHLGLIAAVAQPDELVSVLAHELSHVTQRHISRLMSQESQRTPLLFAALLLGVLAARSNPNALSAAIVAPQALALQNQLSFSRDMEREADRVGLGLMVDAGYAAQGMARMFEKLDHANRINDKGAYPYLRSHPLTTERIADVKARTQLATPKPAGDERALTEAALHSLMAARARVLADTSSTALHQHLRVAEDVSVMQPLVQQLGLLYASAMSAGLLNDFAAAKPVLARLQALVQRRLVQPTPSAAAARQAVQYLSVEHALAAQQGARATALAAQLPASRSTLMVRSQAALAALQVSANASNAASAALASVAPASVVGRSGDGDAGAQAQIDASLAAEQLQLWLSSHGQDAAAWNLLGRLLQAQGKTVRAVLAQAEAQVAHLDFNAGLDRLKAARDLGGQQRADFFEMSIIESRLRQVASLLSEQQRDEATQR
jgi:predicted Zn-dependent protease